MMIAIDILFLLTRPFLIISFTLDKHVVLPKPLILMSNSPYFLVSLSLDLHDEYNGKR
jgi:hypothetical protein